jgi:hypothetical protein
MFIKEIISEKVVKVFLERIKSKTNKSQNQYYPIFVSNILNPHYKS